VWLHLGAWRDGPLTEDPPEGYTRYRAPSAPDERLSRTRGSPDQRRPGDMGHDARRPVGQCGERVDLPLGGRLWWCRSRTV
jgi:hypothetical protein